MKTKAMYGLPIVNNSYTKSSFFIPFVPTNKFVIVGAITVSVGISSITGFVRYFFKNGCNFCGIVAEKTNICKSSGIAPAIASTSGKNPKSIVISASSTTNVSAVWISNAPAVYKSLIRPGVPITICGCELSNWCN